MDIKERDNIIRKKYPTEVDTNELAKRLGITTNRLRSRAYALGVKRCRHLISRNKSAAMANSANGRINAQVVAHYATVADPQVLADSLGITLSSLRKRATRGGVSRLVALTGEALRLRDAAIIERYPTGCNKALARAFNMPVSYLVSRANQLGVVKDKRGGGRKAAMANYRAMLDARIDTVVRREYAATCNHDLAMRLGFTTPQLLAYAKARGLRKSPQHIMTYGRKGASMPRSRRSSIEFRQCARGGTP